jgi:hypothetical protein
MCRRTSWRGYKRCISVGKAPLQTASQVEARYLKVQAPLLLNEAPCQLGADLSWAIQAEYLPPSAHLTAGT